MGSLYAIIQPLGYMLTFLLLSKVVGLTSGGIPYVIMLLTGLVPWLFFSNAITCFASIIQVNSDLIKKMPVTREVFILEGLMTSFFDFIISSLILFLFTIWFHIPFSISLIWLPVIILILFLIMIGLGFFVAVLGAIRTDLQFLLPFLLQLWMFASPVIYPLSQVPESMRWIYSINPMTGIIDSYRMVIAYGINPDPLLLGISLFFGIILVLLGWPFFRYYGQYFADVI